jgi:hypothetical protein
MAAGDGASEAGERTLAGDEPVEWRPVWCGTFEASARTFARKNLWRINKQFEYEDAVQECAVVFLRCCRAYEGKVTSGGHFMALYKRALINDFNNLARRNQRFELVDIAVVEACRRQPTSELPTALLLSSLGRASAELREVLRVIVEGPAELLKVMFSWPDNGRAIELRQGVEPARYEAAYSRSLCRLARVNVRSDLFSELRVLLL